MRWVMYETSNGAEAAGLVMDGKIHGLGEGSRVLDLLGDDGEKLDAAAEKAREQPTEVIELDGAHLGPPVRPPQIRDFLTFLDHLRNARKAIGAEIDQAWNEIPAFYFSNTTGVIGPYDPVAISPGSGQFDYELEIASIIGKAGANLDPDEAEQHIAGFMIFNDWSARDLQIHEMKLSLGPSKGKDGANTLGPMLVTRDELEPFRKGNSYHLEMKGFVNDELVSHGFMDQMDWSWGEIVSYASRGTTVLPGEAICSGTVPTGCLIEHFAVDGPEKFRGWLEPGDVVTLEVEGIGTTRQEVLPSVEVHRLRTGF
jgi:2-keto-4-pentenoate hydratase/2-oxohepta-3-ene-1,7-dioic acid hydratase in catechol pathway